MKSLGILVFIFYSYTAYTQTEIDFYTNMGDFRVQVREDLMPITAGNFINLADTGFYDGLIFHRVVAGFVIQGGDPLGNGTGGPGYTISDEYHPTMNHDSAGVIAMAKSAQPNSAGSQFYFTLGAQSHLDSNYAVFGSCIQGLQVIKDIGKVAVDGNDKPLTDVIMDSVRIVDLTASISRRKETEILVKAEVYPNPFIEAIHINYEVKVPGHVNLNIYDVQGRLVQTLIDEKRSAGIYGADWDGINVNQVNVQEGVYYLYLITPSGTATLKLIMLR
ncbi:peptidylprolyl isomerase [Candidatus Amoebophilus asiaticus]|nr:peptidylprolyl isomerase [Candidatus Amoebophilus asiaticus]